MKPYFSYIINGVTILWFKTSNKYLILDSKTHFLVDSFLDSKSQDQFNQKIRNLQTNSKNSTDAIYFAIEELLRNINIKEEYKVNQLKIPPELSSLTQSAINKFYDFYGINVEVSFKSIFEQNLIHPQYSYLEKAHLKNKPDCRFLINSTNEQIHLFKNNNYIESFNKKDFHLLQGKFAFELLCTITDTAESDWLATFHASSVANDSEALMLIGESGKGKSTFSTILMDYGYNLMTDDFTPMRAKNFQIQPFPSTISIKKGAFNLVESLSNKIQYKSFQSPNKNKGFIRHINPINSTTSPIPCSKVMLINYKKNTQATLNKIKLDEALHVLIPDSWISPLPDHVKSFFKWLETTDFYKLTYDQSADAIALFETILKRNN